MLQTMLDLYISFDAIFVKEAYEAAASRDGAALDMLQELYTAAKPARELYEASMKTGRSLLIGVKKLHEGAGNEALKNDDAFYGQAVRSSLQYHYAIGYGIVAAKLDLDLEETVRTYLFSSLASMVSVATRIMPLGQHESQGMLFRLGKQVAEAPIDLAQLTIDHVNSFSPGLEIAAMEHEILYSRLCMS